MFREKLLHKGLFFHPEVLVYIALIAAALLLSIPLSSGSMLPIIGYCGLLYLFILFKRPEIGFTIGFFILMGLFGIMGRSFLRVEGYFKLLDIVIITLFLSFIKEVLYQSDLRFLIKSPIAKALLLFMGSAIIAGIYAKFHYNVSLISIFQAGRVYLFYSFFFLSLYHIKNKKQLHLFLKIILIASILFSVLYIGQHIIGANLRILLGAKRFGLMSVGSYSTLRLDIRADVFPGLVLPIMLGIAVFSSSKRIKKWAMIAATLFLAETIFTLGRAHWFGVAFSCLIFWFLLPSSKRRLSYKYIIIAGLILIFILPLISMIRYDSPLSLFSLLKERSSSGVRDFAQRTGTFGSRYRLAESYWRLLKNKPIFGLGLIPTRSEEIIQELPKGKIRNVHVGILNIFIDLGLTGCFFFIILVVVAIKRSLYIYRNLQNQLYKALSLGILSAFIGRLAAFTLDTFSTYEEVTIIAIMLGLLEVMFRIDKKYSSAKAIDIKHPVKVAPK